MNANTIPNRFSLVLVAAKISLITAIAVPSVFAREKDQMSAFTALQQVEDRFGAFAVNQIVELRGHRGQSQPESWNLIAYDRESPYLMRQFKIDRKRATDEGAYRDFYPDYIPDGFIQRSKLQVDSSGAFQVLVTEASHAGVGFDSASYHLRSREFSEEPLWRLTALDVDGYTVGRVDLSAATGTVLRTVWYFWDGSHRDAPRIVDSALLGGPGIPGREERERIEVGQISGDGDRPLVSDGDRPLISRIPNPASPAPTIESRPNLRPFNPPPGPPVAVVEPLGLNTANPTNPPSPSPNPPVSVRPELPAVPPAPAPAPAPVPPRFPAPAPPAAAESDLPLPPPLPPSLGSDPVRVPATAVPDPAPRVNPAPPAPNSGPPKRVVNHPEGDPVEVTPLPANP
ncbi:MAG: hypothetical protein ACI8UO_000344 [Verrucomicrobiales bacterium]|jgi:hypothetical protein